MSEIIENSCTDILGPSLDLVANQGLGALTLRPLAAAAQTTLSVLAYRFGKKEKLITALIDELHRQEQAVLQQWRRRIGSVAQVGGVVLAEIADAVLDDLAGPHFKRTLFFSELIQASGWDQNLRPPLAGWLLTRLDFWRALASTLGPSPSPDLGFMLHCYAIDETAYGLALKDHVAYRWLRRLTLRKLCAPQMAPATDGALFQAFVKELAELPDHVGTDLGRVAQNSWETDIIRQISTIIVEKGVEAVTHRAVSTAAGVPLSTLAYHFRRQEDLVKAGLEGIIRDMWRQIDRSADCSVGPASGGASIARATFAVALAATRNPELIACAAAMRRRRGENINRYLTTLTGIQQSYDSLSTQAMSMVYMGHTMLGGVGGAPLQPMATQEMFGQVRAWLGMKGPM